ncbi:MAG: energy transducer TonB [Methanosarcina sp.]
MSRRRAVHFLVSITAMILIQSSFNKISAQSTEEIFVAAEVMPSFPGGTTALMTSIYKNITYPQDAKDNGIEGKVILRFVVTKEGNVVQPTIIKGLCPSIDKAVLDVVPKIPRFQPGSNGGKPVNIWYSIPITFKLVK